MGTQKTVAVYVGIFVIVGLTVLMWLSLEVEGIALGADYVDLVAEFDNVLGLSPGNPVTMRGVEIGRVGAMDIDAETGRPRVTVRVREEWGLRQNAVARLVTTDVLGQKSIDIAYPDEGPQGEVLADGAQIQTEETTDLAEVLQSLGETLGGTTDDIQGLIQSIDENQEEAFTAFTSLIEDNRPRIDSIIEQMEAAIPDIRQTAQTLGELASSAREGEGTVARLLNDPELADDIAVSAANMRDISERIRDAEGTLWRLIEEDALYEDTQSLVTSLRESADGLEALLAEEDGSLASLGELADSLNEAMPDLRAGLENFREISQKINEGEGTIGLLINDPTLYNEIRALLRRLGETFEEAEETGVIRTFLAVFFGAFI